MDLMAFLRRLLLLYFPEWGKNREKNVALSKIMARLRQRPNCPYVPLTDTMLPAFATSVQSLERLASRLRPLYQKTVGAGTRLLWRRLEALGFPPSAFVFPVAEGAGLADGGDLETWDRQFDTRLAVFQTAGVTRLAQAWSMHQRLADLCAFDFDGLLKPFRASSPSGPFGPAVGPSILEPLQDLLFLLPGIRIDEGVSSLVPELAELAALTDPRAQPTLAGIDALLRSSFDPKDLADIARCIAGDPELVPRAAPEPVDLLGPLVEGLIAAYQTGKREYLKLQSDQDFQNRLQALFGNHRLDRVDGYASTDQSLLVGCGLPEYRNVAPLQVLKNFWKHHYQPRIRQAMGSFMLEVEFTDAKFKASFVEAVDALDRCLGRLGPFEEDTQVFLRTRIHSQLENLRNGLVARSAVERLKLGVEEIESVAERIVQGAFPALLRLEEHLTRLRNDLAARAPELIANRSQILTHSTHVGRDLDESLTAIHAVLGLLRQVAVYLGAVPPPA